MSAVVLVVSVDYPDEPRVRDCMKKLGQVRTYITRRVEEVTPATVQKIIDSFLREDPNENITVTHVILPETEMDGDTLSDWRECLQYLFFQDGERNAHMTAAAA